MVIGLNADTLDACGVFSSECTIPVTSWTGHGRPCSTWVISWSIASVMSDGRWSRSSRLHPSGPVAALFFFLRRDLVHCSCNCDGPICLCWYIWFCHAKEIYDWFPFRFWCIGMSVPPLHPFFSELLKDSVTDPNFRSWVSSSPTTNWVSPSVLNSLGPTWHNDWMVCPLCCISWFGSKTSGVINGQSLLSHFNYFGTDRFFQQLNWWRSWFCNVIKNLVGITNTIIFSFLLQLLIKDFFEVMKFRHEK